jgi:hypothetical protein
MEVTIYDFPVDLLVTLKVRVLVSTAAPADPEVYLTSTTADMLTIALGKSLFPVAKANSDGINHLSGDKTTPLKVR